MFTKYSVILVGLVCMIGLYFIQKFLCQFQNKLIGIVLPLLFFILSFYISIPNFNKHFTYNLVMEPSFHLSSYLFFFFCSPWHFQLNIGKAIDIVKQFTFKITWEEYYICGLFSDSLL